MVVEAGLAMLENSKLHLELQQLSEVLLLWLRNLEESPAISSSSGCFNISYRNAYKNYSETEASYAVYPPEQSEGNFN